MSPVAKRVVAHRQLVRVEDDEDVDDDESDAWNVDGASVVSANGKKVTWTPAARERTGGKGVAVAVRL